MIVASKLTKYYGDRAAVRETSFSDGCGRDRWIPLGLNGAGKSTTLRIISCQLVPTTGTVTVGGLDVLDHSQEIRKRIGYLPEVPPVYPEMTVHEYLLFVARIKGVARGAVKDRVAQAEENTRVAHVRHQVIGTLSAGYRQRVGIAQAVVHQPDLLILDEPFAGLDPVQTVEMREMIRRLGGKHTVLLSSHLLSQIHETCDRILVIQKGRIVAQGKEDELVSMLTAAAEIEVEVRGPEPVVAQTLSAVDGVASCRTQVLDDGVVRARVATTTEVREALAAAVVQAGLGLRSLRRSSAELESVFVQLSRGGEGEAPLSPGSPSATSEEKKEASSTADAPGEEAENS